MSSQPVRFLPLGGLGEIGMNCMAVEHGEDILVIDCGVLFDNRNLGVDVIHADFEWLLARRDNVRALVLTHGHEDHIGAVSYFLRDFDVPVYAPPYTMALLRGKLSEHPWHNMQELQHQLHVVPPGSKYDVACFGIESFSVTHSMPECTGLVLTTPQGIVVHSGDFKIDDTPPPGDKMDLERLAELGKRGVRVLLSDSTNSMSEGSSGQEVGAARSLEELIAKTEERAVVALFASNVHRMRALFDIARKVGRKVALFGRSVDTHVRIASELGFLPDTSDVLIPRDRARSTPRRDLLVLATGSQGEPAAALPRLANGTHPELELSAGDSVFLSSRIIPGNERPILDLINSLERRGIPVTHRGIEPEMHVSGHAHRGEQRRLIDLISPEIFLPVHGTFVHLRKHAETARAAGVKEVFVIENGTALELGPNGGRVGERFSSGRVHVGGGEPLPSRVIQDRQLLAQLGVVMISLCVDERDQLVGEPLVLTRGVIDEELESDLLADLITEISRAVRSYKPPRHGGDADGLRDVARRAARRFLQREIGQKPLAYASVLRTR